MSTKRRQRHSPKQIVRKLRDADGMLNSGKELSVVLQSLEISQTHRALAAAVRRHSRRVTYGAPDEIGLWAVENRVHVHDIHATNLHCCGLNHEQLTFLAKWTGRATDGKRWPCHRSDPYLDLSAVSRRQSSAGNR